ncbi:MAG: (d)CMP kinase [Ruminococcaceae bacterium]|nr:(d)CMP kinase [Oscillospiraceae bacterium]
MKIAIDGPSGAGKSTFAKLVAKELSLVYVDTGALYRSIGLYVNRKGVDPKDAEKVVPLLSEISLELKYSEAGQRVVLNGEDVSDLIRTPEISMCASAVSAIPAVREFLLKIQRDMVDKGDVVMDGRDIGTVIMPDADVKLFMFARPETRAKRRYAELVEKGIECDYDSILADIIQRDKNDSEREIAPAVPAEDAIMFENADEIPVTLAKMLEIIKENVK